MHWKASLHEHNAHICNVRFSMCFIFRSILPTTFYYFKLNVKVIESKRNGYSNFQLFSGVFGTLNPFHINITSFSSKSERFTTLVKHMSLKLFNKWVTISRYRRNCCTICLPQNVHGKYLFLRISFSKIIDVCWRQMNKQLYESLQQ